VIEINEVKSEASVVVKADNNDTFASQFERKFEKYEDLTDKSGCALTNKTPISIDISTRVDKPINKISPKFSKSFVQTKSLESRRGKPCRSIIGNLPCAVFPMRPFQNQNFFRALEKPNDRKSSKNKAFTLNNEIQMGFKSNPLANRSKDKRSSDPESGICQLSQTIKLSQTKTISNRAPPPSKGFNIKPQPKLPNTDNLVYLDFDLSPSRIVKNTDPNACILPDYQSVSSIARSKSREGKCFEMVVQSDMNKSRPKRDIELKAYQTMCLGPLVSDLQSLNISAKRRKSSNITDPPISTSTNCDTN